MSAVDQCVRSPDPHRPGLSSCPAEVTPMRPTHAIDADLAATDDRAEQDRLLEERLAVTDGPLRPSQVLAGRR
jgi:hypothetical protein